jgi:hypothetical protein
MSNTHSAQDLGQRIEQLIQEHFTASRLAAAEAVARGFGAAASKPSIQRGRASKPSPGRKRPSADIAALGERFYEALCARPGETMTVLSAEVGASARDLQRPVTLLRRAGKVRSVGTRQATRYYPMAGEGQPSL